MLLDICGMEICAHLPGTPVGHLPVLMAIKRLKHDKHGTMKTMYYLFKEPNNDIDL